MTTATGVRTHTPTVAELLALVEEFGPNVEDGALMFDRDPPTDLVPVLRVLHTGIRAHLTGRRWYGCDGDTGRIVELQQAARLPWGITLLCVEGDSCWDRIHPAATLDLPSLFAPPP